MVQCTLFPCTYKTKISWLNNSNYQPPIVHSPTGRFTSVQQYAQRCRMLAPHNACGVECLHCRFSVPLACSSPLEVPEDLGFPASLGVLEGLSVLKAPRILRMLNILGRWSFFEGGEHAEGTEHFTVQAPYSASILRCRHSTALGMLLH